VISRTLDYLSIDVWSQSISLFLFLSLSLPPSLSLSFSLSLFLSLSPSPSVFQIGSPYVAQAILKLSILPLTSAGIMSTHIPIMHSIVGTSKEQSQIKLSEASTFQKP
jgi:hypothetical protein